MTQIFVFWMRHNLVINDVSLIKNQPLARDLLWYSEISKQSMKSSRFLAEVNGNIIRVIV